MFFQAGPKWATDVGTARPNGYDPPKAREQSRIRRFVLRFDGKTTRRRRQQDGGKESHGND